MYKHCALMGLERCDYAQPLPIWNISFVLVVGLERRGHNFEPSCACVSKLGLVVSSVTRH